MGFPTYYLLTLRCSACHKVAAHLTEIGGTLEWVRADVRNPCFCPWVAYPSPGVFESEIRRARQKLAKPGYVRFYTECSADWTPISRVPIPPEHGAVTVKAWPA